MAYWKNSKVTDIGAIGKDWVAKTAYRVFKTLQSKNKFYELEPAEVLEIALNEESLPKTEDGNPNFNFLGAVKARKIESERELSSGALKWMRPLDIHISDYPVIGECVLSIKLPFSGREYYLRKMDLLGRLNQNELTAISWGSVNRGLKEGLDADAEENSEIADTGTPTYTAEESAADSVFKLGKIFEPSKKIILKLQPLEGDIIFQGRFGQSIRFGSNQTEEGDGQKESPNILMRAGQLMDGESPDVGLVNEDINADGSSIWMTTDQKVDLQWAHEDGVGPPPLEGKNIVLNSDRIIFNAKVDEIYGSAKTRITFEAPEILLGADGSQGNIPNGELLVAALSSLVDLVKKMTTKPPQSPFPPDIGLALPQVKKDLEEAINTIAFVQMKE